MSEKISLDSSEPTYNKVPSGFIDKLVISIPTGIEITGVVDNCFFKSQ